MGQEVKLVAVHKGLLEVSTTITRGLFQSRSDPLTPTSFTSFQDQHAGAASARRTQQAQKQPEHPKEELSIDRCTDVHAAASGVTTGGRCERWDEDATPRETQNQAAYA